MKGNEKIKRFLKTVAAVVAAGALTLALTVETPAAKPSTLEDCDSECKKINSKKDVRVRTSSDGKAKEVELSDVNLLYLNNAYSALHVGNLDSARKQYRRYKDLSGSSDDLFEEELSKADGTYLWSEDELKSKGFIIGCEDGNYGGFGYLDEGDKYNLTFSRISGPDGKFGLIESNYGDMRFLEGDVVDGFLNGLCLLIPDKKMEGEFDETVVFNNICELAYICNGKVVTPTVGVIMDPIFLVQSDPVAEYRNSIYLNEYGLRYYDFEIEGERKKRSPMVSILEQIFSPDLLDYNFLSEFKNRRVDMEYIRHNFAKFMNSNKKIPSHAWEYK